MQDLISYVYEYQNINFKEQAFNEIDAFVFAQLAYINYNQVFCKHPRKKGLSIHKIIQALDMKEVEKSILNGEKNKRLLLAVASSKRYSRLRIKYYVDYINHQDEVQFCAMVFMMKKHNCVVFKGTDETFIGWKEDFNMLVQEEVPSQKAGILYLNDVVRKLKGKIYIAGHSKGGNVAVYGFHYMHKKLQDKITKVYNFDGPGHMSKQIQANLVDRIVKYSPPASIVGALFDNNQNRNIIKSKAVWLAQHDAYSWIIEQGSFLYLDIQQGVFEKMNKRILDWLNTQNQEAREQFIEAIYCLIQNCNLSTVDEFTHSWKKYSKELLKQLTHMDKDMKKHILSTIHSLLKGLVK